MSTLVNTGLNPAPNDAYMSQLTLKAMRISKNKTYVRSWKRTPISEVPRREPLYARFLEENPYKRGFWKFLEENHCKRDSWKRTPIRVVSGREPL